MRRPAVTRLVLPVSPLTVRGAGADRPRVLREVKDAIATDARRRRLNRKPEFVSITEHRDAGETEMPDEVTA